MTQLCFNCFHQHDPSAGNCPQCGFDLEQHRKDYPFALSAGNMLNNRYYVGRVLGQGGFGITYVALDTNLNAKVAIKEFMPSELATRVDGRTVSVYSSDKEEEFNYGEERFLEEARTLAQFIGNPNIAGVSNYFTENDTSYFVMDYIEGVSFKDYIANQGGQVSLEDALNVMNPVLNALSAVHQAGFIHRDVTPDNIFITKDGGVKLLDFGSARYSIGDKSKSLDVILKVGYAPKEQYIRRGRQGPFTDVYSCAACLYACLTGYLPPESLERMEEDTLTPVSQVLPEIPQYINNAILKGLAVNAEDRFQSAQEFLQAIESQTVVQVPTHQSLVAEPVKQKSPLIAVAAILAVAIIGVGAMFVFGGNKTTETIVVNEAGETISVQTSTSVSTGKTVTILGQEVAEDTTSFEYKGYVGDAELAEICTLTNLQKLSLYDADCYDLSDLSPISTLENLEELKISTVDSGDYSDLSTLSQLKVLSLDMDAGASAPDDISFLAGLTSLEEFRATVSISDMDFEPLRNLTNLVSLEIYNACTTPSSNVDLSPIANLVNLEFFRYNHNVESLEPFRNLINLTYLELVDGYQYDKNGFDSLEPLSNLTNLAELYLRCQNVSTLEGLSTLTSLTKLSLSGCSVSNVYPISNLENLKTFTLSSTVEVTNAALLSNIANVSIS